MVRTGLTSGSQPEAILPPADTWQCLETFSVVTTRGGEQGEGGEGGVVWYVQLAESG